MAQDSTREAVRIRSADAAGAGAMPLPAGGITKTSQWKFKQKVPGAVFLE
jgi:hypothetical protein